MLILIAALAVAADTPPAAQATDSDSVVCKRARTSDVGTHMRPKPVCMKKSEWDLVEKHTQTELQSLHERSSFDPGKAEGHGPN
jgi:hypothetical protein